VKFKELDIQYMGIRRTVTIKYEAQLVICKGISSFFVVDNHLKNWEKDHGHRAQGMQRKAVPIYLQHHVHGTEAVQGHALGTCNRIQKSMKVQRKKNTSV